MLLCWSYTPVLGNEYNNKMFDIEYDMNPNYFLFIIGSIYNVEHFYDIDFESHYFECGFVLYFYVDTYGYVSRGVYKDGEFEYFSNIDEASIKTYFRGFIGENFICAYEVVKWQSR